jgi:hypothetical protein
VEAGTVFIEVRERLLADYSLLVGSNKKSYVDRVKRRLDDLEKAGWSLPLYRETILADAAKVEF